MAKKKTKAASPSTPVDRAVARVATRGRRWRDRIDQLDEWIDRGAEIDQFPYRGDLCEAEYRRRLSELGKDGAPSLQDFARHGWRHDELFSLEDDLRLAGRRLEILDGYTPEWRAPVDALLSRRFGRSDKPPPKVWSRRSDLAVLQGAIESLRRLLESDGVARAVAAEKRKPSPLEAAILEVLLDADRSLTGEEIAARVARGKSKLSKPARAILAAIGKIRGELGIPDLKAQHGVGFKLKAEQVGIARRLLART
jgi:hypothetical protein